MKLRRSILALGVSAVMVCLPLLGGNAATISPVSGSTAINGQTLLAGSALLPGQTVTVSAKSTARIQFSGSSVLAAANTSFRLADSAEANRLVLTFGGLNVNGTVSVAVGAHTMVPQANAQYEVRALKNVNYLQVNAGTVSLQAFGRTETVRAGEAVSFDNAAPQAGAAATGGAAGAAGGGLSLPVAVGIVAATSILVGVGTYAATNCSTCTPSPIQP